MSAPVSYMIPPLKAPKKTSEEVHTGFARASISPMPTPKPPSPDEDDLGPVTTVIQHAFSIDIKDNFQNSGTAHIHLWCLNRDSNPVLIRMPEFPVFCYAQLPAFVDGTPMHWDASNAVHVIRYLKFALKDDAPTKAGLESKTLLHYFRGEAKTPMLILVFPTIKAMQHCQNLMNTPKQIRGVGLMKLEMWETSISIVRKMFTLRKCRFSQWFEIRGRQVPFESERRVAKSGTPEHPIEEYLCQWETLIPIPPEVSKSWMTQPRMLAIDIETYSDNHHAMPDEHNTLHVAYMISCVYQQLGKPETRHATLIVMGPCDPIPGSDVISCTSEHEMIIEMGKLIDRVDPDIITGYNIFSYDYPYLHARLSVKMLDWPQMSRLQGVTPQMTSKSWKSGAYGHNRINNLVMDGRISIDMLPIIRRDYKLDKYDLDFVSRFFIKKGKHDVKASRMFEIYEELQAATTSLALAQDIPVTQSQAEIEIAALRAALGLPQPLKLDSEAAIKVSVKTAQARYAAATAEMRRVGEYCLQDSALVIDLFQKLNVWIGLIELSSIVGVTIVELFTRGQQVRTLSQLYDLASSLGYVIDKRSAPKMFYNGGFVFDPKPGLYDNIICIDFASLYPSIMMAYNVCYTTLVPREFDREIPDEQCNVNEFDQEEPIDGRPSRGNHVNDEGEGVVEGVNDDPEAADSDEDDEPAKKTVTRHYRFRFVKREVRDGILPQLVRRLVDERNAVRAYMKVLEAQKKAFNTGIGILRAGAIPEIKDFEGEITLENLKTAVDDVELQLTVLDKRQNALKVSANSMYGFLGAQDGGFLPLIEGAMSVTAWGRSLISQVNRYIETKYGGTIVYGDTDSSMADLHITDPKEVNPMGHRLAVEISGTPEKKLDDGTIVPAVAGLFPPPLRVEFEKGQRLLCIKKKKYAYLLVRDDGSFAKDRDTGEVVIFKKGIAIARRDNCLAGSSLVTLTNGLSVRIDQMDKYARKVYGFDGNRLSQAYQTVFIPNGRRACIKLTLMDGRTITCTPEHRILVRQPDGAHVWKMASQIDMSKDFVVCGLEAPEDVIGDDEEDWELRIGDYVLNLTTHRDVTLAFMRLLGYMNADGNLNVREDGRIDCGVAMGHYIDALTLVDDVEIICGFRPAITPRVTAFSSFYAIRIPNAISEIFIDIPGQTLGRRCDSLELSWPEFLLDEECPKAVMREFVGGLMGGDGTSPWVGSGKMKDPAMLCQSILIGMSSKPENQSQMRIKMLQLCDMLRKLGLKDVYLGDKPEHCFPKKDTKDPKDARMMFRIFQSHSTVDFLRLVGFRYCIHKQMRQTAAQTLWRFEEIIKADRLRTIKLAAEIYKPGKGQSMQKAFDIAQALILQENLIYPPAVSQMKGRQLDYYLKGELSLTDPTLRRRIDMPKTRDWLSLIGALEFFEKEGVSKVYSVSRESTSLPNIYLPCINIEVAGFEDVYDITVDKLESFVANGVVVHNCRAFRDVYTNLLRGILTGMPIVEGFGIIAEACAQLLNHEIKPKGQLTIIRELGANYKQDSYFLKVFADELRRMGKPANPGDRLEYVVVRTREEQAGLEIPLGRKMRSIEMWEESQEVFGSGPPPLPLPGEKGVDTTMMYVAEDIDAVYYIGHVFQNAIDQLFGVGYMGQLERLKTIGYTPQHSRRKFTSVETPIGMIVKFIDDTLRSFAHFTNPEREKLAHIAQTIRKMPTWFSEQIDIHSRSPSGV